jgi:hypothetical protein
MIFSLPHRHSSTYLTQKSYPIRQKAAYRTIVAPHDKSPEIIASAMHLFRALLHELPSVSSSAAKAGAAMSQARTTVKTTANDLLTKRFFKVFMITSLSLLPKQVPCQNEGRDSVSNEVKIKKLKTTYYPEKRAPPEKMAQSPLMRLLLV